MSTAINEQLVNIPDKDAVGEFKTYPRADVGTFTKGKDENAKHWDRVMAICILWQMRLFARSNKVTLTDSGTKFDEFGMINQI